MRMTMTIHFKQTKMTIHFIPKTKSETRNRQDLKTIMDEMRVRCQKSKLNNSG